MIIVWNKIITYSNHDKNLFLLLKLTHSFFPLYCTTLRQARKALFHASLQLPCTKIPFSILYLGSWKVFFYLNLAAHMMLAKKILHLYNFAIVNKPCECEASHIASHLPHLVLEFLLIWKIMERGTYSSHM